MIKLKFSPLPETGRLSREDATRYFSIFGFASFALGAINFIAQFLLVNLIYYTLPSLYAWPFFGSVLIIVTLYGCAFPVFYLILRRLPKIRPVREKQSFRFLITSLCICFCFTAIGNYLSGYMVALFESLSGSQLINPVTESMESTPLWGTLLFTVVLAPIMEELVFRKILCDRLLPLGESYAIVLSAALFALAHGNFYQIFYAFLIGACLGYVYVKSGKIGYSIAFHLIINLVFGFLPTLLSGMMDMNALNELMEQMAAGGNEQALMEQMMALLEANPWPLFLLAQLSLLQYGGIIAGTILLIVCLVKKRISLEEGLLPPPSDARVSPIFLNSGVALAIAVYVFLMIYSLL